MSDLDPDLRKVHTATGTDIGCSPDTPDTRDQTFEAFYRATVSPLTGFLVVQGATVAQAADIVQDTLTTAYQRWHDITHPRAWAYRVASRNFVRRRLDHSEIPVDPPPHPPLLQAGDFEHWEQRQDLVQALARLPERQRQVMAWSLYEYTPTEIAEELRIEPGTVRQHLYLARRALSTQLSRNEGRR
jgi:RNA polymerase sigma factor (sigma-70 family)